MTVKEYYEITNGIDEYNVYKGSKLIKKFYRDVNSGDSINDEVIDECFIGAEDDGSWVVCNIYII